MYPIRISVKLPAILNKIFLDFIQYNTWIFI